MLIDTNVISELRKGPRCDLNVASWYATVPEAGIFLSVLVLGEICRGIALAARRDPMKAKALEHWMFALQHRFADRLLGVDGEVAEQWGQMSARRSVPVIDGLMAATAKVHDLTLITRNARDVAGLGVRVLDPFRLRPPA